MPELEIGLADVSALYFGQSFRQFKAKKKTNAKKSSQFEFKSVSNFQTVKLLFRRNNKI